MKITLELTETQFIKFIEGKPCNIYDDFNQRTDFILVKSEEYPRDTKKYNFVDYVGVILDINPKKCIPKNNIVRMVIYSSHKLQREYLRFISQDPVRFIDFDQV